MRADSRIGDPSDGNIEPRLSFIVYGPDSGGKVTIAAASLDHPLKSLSVVRASADGASEVVIAKALRGAITDAPQPGFAHLYLLRQGSTTLARRELDLRDHRRLVFTGGTKSRGLFRVTQLAGNYRDLVITAGNPIRGEFQDDQGSVEYVETRALLIEVRLEDWRLSTAKVDTLTDRRGKVLKGLDGQPLRLHLDLPSGKPEKRMVAYVIRNGETSRLVEGDSIPIPD